jgi:hypothetical protein
VGDSSASWRVLSCGPSFLEESSSTSLTETSAAVAAVISFLVWSPLTFLSALHFKLEGLMVRFLEESLSELLLVSESSDEESDDDDEESDDEDELAFEYGFGGRPLFFLLVGGTSTLSFL